MGNYKIVLASGSPRRIELMRKVLPEVEIIPPDVDERIQKDDLSPEELVLSIAEKKAMSVRDKVDRGIIVAADTIVVLDDKIFGKPHTEEEAERMICELQGREHSVYTGVVIVKVPDNIVRRFAERSKVKIKAMNDDEVTTYIKHAKWQDKAGAYGIQETPDIVEYYHGDYYNIVGLPVDKTLELIHKVRDTHVLYDTAMLFGGFDRCFIYGNRTHGARECLPYSAPELTYIVTGGQIHYRISTCIYSSTYLG